MVFGGTELLDVELPGLSADLRAMHLHLIHKGLGYEHWEEFAHHFYETLDGLDPPLPPEIKAKAIEYMQSTREHFRCDHMSMRRGMHASKHACLLCVLASLLRTVALPLGRACMHGGMWPVALCPCKAKRKAKTRKRLIVYCIVSRVYCIVSRTRVQADGAR